MSVPVVEFNDDDITTSFCPLLYVTCCFFTVEAVNHTGLYQIVRGAS